MNGTIITDIANIENSKNVMKMVTLNPDEPWLWLISELVEGATKMPGWLLTTIEEEGVEETTEALVETTIGKGVTVPEKKIWIVVNHFLWFLICHVVKMWWNHIMSIHHFLTEQKTTVQNWWNISADLCPKKAENKVFYIEKDCVKSRCQ